LPQSTNYNKKEYQSVPKKQNQDTSLKTKTTVASAQESKPVIQQQNNLKKNNAIHETIVVEVYSV
jgi:hypothetical protein